MKRIVFFISVIVTIDSYSQNKPKEYSDDNIATFGVVAATGLAAGTTLIYLGANNIKYAKGNISDIERKKMNKEAAIEIVTGGLAIGIGAIFTTIFALDCYNFYHIPKNKKTKISAGIGANGFSASINF